MIVIINHTRCDTVCLETLVNIGNIIILEINIRIFKKIIPIHLHAKDSILLDIIRKEVTHSGVERNKIL